MERIGIEPMTSSLQSHWQSFGGGLSRVALNRSVEPYFDLVTERDGTRTNARCAHFAHRAFVSFFAGRCAREPTDAEARLKRGRQAGERLVPDTLIRTHVSVFAICNCLLGCLSACCVGRTFSCWFVCLVRSPR